MSGAEKLLEAKRLEAWYGAAQILFELDLHVNRGEVVALMGRNGAGKSTTLKSIMGMLDKRRGSISFMGHDISKTEPYHAARLGLAFVPEDRRIFYRPNRPGELVGRSSAPKNLGRWYRCARMDTRTTFQAFPQPG